MLQNRYPEWGNILSVCLISKSLLKMFIQDIATCGDNQSAGKKITAHAYAPLLTPLSGGYMFTTQKKDKK